MSDSCPVKVCRHIPSLMSQSFAEASQAPETNSLVSGARDRLMTSPVWPANVVVCWPVSMSHRALKETENNFSDLKWNTRGSVWVAWPARWCCWLFKVYHDSTDTELIFEVHRANFFDVMVLNRSRGTHFRLFNVFNNGVLYLLALCAVPQLTRWCLQSWWQSGCHPGSDSRKGNLTKRKKRY